MRSSSSSLSDVNPETAAPRKSRVPFAQVVFAIVLSALCCLVLIMFQNRLGQSLRHGERFFGYWTQFVCVLLTFWALSMLFVRWRRSAKRARCVANTAPQLTSTSDDDAAKQWVEAAEHSATRFGDSFLVVRIRRLVEEFRITRDVTAVAAALSTESELARADIETAYTPVRIFAWTIPILGFVGTVLGIGQAVGVFAAFLATGAQRQDEIRTALTKVTTDLAFAFETTLIAVLLTLVVTVLYVLLQHQESRILRAVDELCRSRLLPLFRRDTALSTGGASAATASGSEPSSKERSDLDFQWAFELGRLRAELTEAYMRSSELAKQYLEGTQAVSEDVARLMKATEESVAVQREALDLVVESARGALERPEALHFSSPEHDVESASNGADVESARDHHSDNGTEARNGTPPAVSDIGALSMPLDDLRDTIREVNPILRRLAEHLRQQAEEATQSVTLKFQPRSPAASSGE